MVGLLGLGVRYRRRIGYAISMAAGLIAAWSLSTTVESPGPEAGAVGHEGDQLVMVFIGSTSCSINRTESVRRDVREAMGWLDAYAKREGMSFLRIGVVESESPHEGWTLLESIGAFNEVAVGGRWSNTALLKYMVRDLPGPDETPQILVLRRKLGPEGWGIQEEALLKRLVGDREIAEWVRSSHPSRGLHATET